MNEQQLKLVLNQLADGLTDVDLLPSIRARLKTSKQYSHQGDLSMNPKRNRVRRLRLASALLLTVLAAAALILVTPQGRTYAQSFLSLFTHHPSDTRPAPTEPAVVWVQQTPGVAQSTPTPPPPAATLAFSAECGDLTQPRCSTDQIRGRVNFTVKEPAYIPVPLYFTGATGGPDRVWLLYDTPDHTGFLIINEAPWTGSLSQAEWGIGASAEVKTVQICSLEGEYVKGDWTYQSGDTTQTWDPNRDAQMLRWIDGGVLITMQLYGIAWEQEKLIGLAAHFTTESVSAQPTPTPSSSDQWVSPYNLTLSEAEQQAGFNLRLPAVLPEFLLFEGALYVPERNEILAFYHYNYANFPDNTDGLVIREQLISANGECRLCGMVRGQYTNEYVEQSQKLVGPLAIIDAVQIGDVNGEYVEGVWHGTDCYGWVWESDPYVKTLRFQSDGYAYELAYYGLAVSKDDLVAIASYIR
jgi:hypothetical protein